ncbi:MAG: phenylalanine--tRNA ligase beta subunit-related protein [Thermomicrobiales bacterium]
MITFTVAPDLFALFPGLSVAGAVAHGLDNQTANPATGARWHAAWRAASTLGSSYPNAQSHPHVAPWREAMRAAGAAPKQFPSSIEAILRRAMKGGEPFAISPLVDGYNSVSLDLVIPAGGFDLDDLPAGLELRRTVAGDTFLTLGDAEAIVVSPGEYGYASGSTVLTRHIAWRQSRRAAITAGTRSVVLLSEILPGVEAATPGIAARVASALATLLRDDFGADAIPFQIDEAHPAISLRP